MALKNYDTTFSKEVEIELADYISASFLKEIIKMISRRMTLKKSDVQLSFRTNMGAKFETSSDSGMEAVLSESKKYKRAIDTINISTGIIHKSKKSGTHYKVDLRIQKIQNQFHGFLYVYAVAGSTADSQHVIDWGTGFIADFKSLNIDASELTNGDLVIDAEDGMVRGWTSEERSENDIPQKVEVINMIETSPPKWSDKSTILTIAGLVLAAVAIIVGWPFFT